LPRVSRSMHAKYTSPGSSSQPSLTPSTCGVNLFPNSPSLSSSTRLCAFCTDSIFRCCGTYRSALNPPSSPLPPSRRCSLVSLLQPPYLSLGPFSRSRSRSLIPATCGAPCTQCRRSRGNRGTQRAHSATRIVSSLASVRNWLHLQHALLVLSQFLLCTSQSESHCDESLQCVVLRSPSRLLGVFAVRTPGCSARPRDALPHPVLWQPAPFLANYFNDPFSPLSVDLPLVCRIGTTLRTAQPYTR
jgi:hypothetical protein